MLRTFFILLFCLSFLQCKTQICPPDEKIGSLELSKETINVIPYNGSEILRFVNKEQEEIILQASSNRELLKDKRCIETICTASNLTGSSSCKYYETEAQQFLFENESKSLIFKLLFYTELYDAKRKTFYDVCQVNLSFKTYKTQASMLTKLRFNPPYKQEGIAIENFLQAAPSLQLNEQAFDSVWAHETDPLKIYYNTEKGLLGFKVNEEVWALQN